MSKLKANIYGYCAVFRVYEKYLKTKYRRQESRERQG
jgi:hypothetical protein